MSPDDTAPDWLAELCEALPEEVLATWKAGGYTLSTFTSRDQVSKYRPDLAACEAALAKVPGGDRYLIVSTATAKVEIYLHPRETIRQALEQCQAELAAPSSYFEVGFDSPEEEALARRAVPELLARLEGGAL